MRAPVAMTSIFAVALMGSDPLRRATLASAPAPAPPDSRAHSARIAWRLILESVQPFIDVATEPG
jgi:hypothetical protein